MIARNQSLCYLIFLSGGLLAASVGGCQGPGSPAGTPEAQVAPDAAASTTPAAAQESKPPAGEEQPKVVKVAKRRPSGRQPQMTIEKDTLDLGEVGIETKITGEFKFTNTGNAPLKITHVVGCCGVALKGVEAGQEYAPGQGGTLAFQLRAPSMPNPAAKWKLYLESNDPECKIATLSFKVAVVRRVDYKPERLKLVLNQPNGGCPDIRLTSVDKKPFSITGFQSTADTITAEFQPDMKATEFVLKPKVDMAKIEGNLVGRISITLTHPECNDVELWYDVLPEYTLSPATIMMFGLKAGQSVTRDFWILNNYQEDFEIESVSSQNGIVKLQEKTKVDSRYRLRVEVVPPTQKRNDILVTDTLEIKIKNGKTLTVPFRGFYQ